ncbi:hypothetical protein CL656_02830 [bacterium]|nr:hypothetical protein [bacterium]|tara:strand:- start:5420 stop:6649 length:1230 start_codon:yes stop_codon:yes gene_type:complete
MQIFQELNQFLDQINQEPLNQEKENLQREINFLIEKVNILQNQIIENQSLEPLEESNLEQEFQDLVDTIHKMYLVHLELSKLQEDIRSLEIICTERQTQLFEILFQIERIITLEFNNYKEFEPSSNLASYNQYVEELQLYLKHQVSGRLFTKVESRIKTMFRKARQFENSNKKLELAKSNLDSFLDQIKDMDFIIETQTPNQDFSIGQITPVLELVHQDNLQKIKTQAEEESKQKQIELHEKLQKLAGYSKLRFLLSITPLFFLGVHYVSQHDSQNDCQKDSGKVTQNQENTYLENNMQIINSDDEMREFSHSLLNSKFLKFSSPEAIQLYKYSGQTRQHFILFLSPTEYRYFHLYNEGINSIKSSVQRVFGPHKHVFLNQYSFQPNHELTGGKYSTVLQESALVYKLY